MMDDPLSDNTRNLLAAEAAYEAAYFTRDRGVAEEAAEPLGVSVPGRRRQLARFGSRRA